MRLLLVDDDVFLRDMYATKFIEAGHEVVEADGPIAALSRLRRDVEFDVVLLDMIMPGMSGVELIHKAKSEFDKDLTYIVLSNQGQREDVEEAEAAGAVGYIIKAEMVPSQVVEKVEALASTKK